MSYVCQICKLLPSSHSLTKMTEKKGIIYYYTCPSQAILYYDVRIMFLKTHMGIYYFGIFSFFGACMGL